jgi:hypothetical protein
MIPIRPVVQTQLKYTFFVTVSHLFHVQLIYIKYHFSPLYMFLKKLTLATENSVHCRDWNPRPSGYLTKREKATALPVAPNRPDQKKYCLLLRWTCSHISLLKEIFAWQTQQITLSAGKYHSMSTSTIVHICIIFVFYLLVTWC